MDNQSPNSHHILPATMATVFAQDTSHGEYVCFVLFFLVEVQLIPYAVAKFINIIRAIKATRFFTSVPIRGGVMTEVPIVTVQICAYNESSVIEDTMDSACSVDWPRDKLFVQVLDDSTDETTEIVEAAAARWRERGVHCERLTRTDRIGYKAGSLHHHTKSIRGEFVALLDADHRCEPQFLRRTVPHFFDGNGNQKCTVGLVQLPWAYYNIHKNVLTEYDAMCLDVSHVIEQTGRSAALRCFGFNGTGGVWSRQAILDGKGWQWDTVTEDLDLSYMAHMAGYDFVYLRDLPQELEVPSGIRAHVQQKHRWTKGYLQVARKSLWAVITSDKTKFATKFEAVTHITGPMQYLWTLILISFFPVLSLLDNTPALLSVLPAAIVFPHILALVITAYAKVPGSSGHYKTIWSRTIRAILLSVVVCLVALGMTVFEVSAVKDGLFSDDATFHRTPKEGSSGSSTESENFTSIIDSEDNDEEDVTYTENQVNEVISDGAGTASGIVLTGSKKKWCSFSKYTHDLFLGLLGLLWVGYLIVWVAIAVLDFVGHDNTALLRVIVTAFPIPGILLVHGSFVMALLKRSPKKLLTKKSPLEDRKACPVHEVQTEE